jgi:outer membrane immunogenic protein
MRKTLLASTLLCGMSSYVLAADAIVEDAVVELAPAFNWTGAYIGGQVGYLWGDGHLEFDGDGFGDPDPDGWQGGVYIGYNYQMANNVVLGVEADAMFGDVEGFGDGFQDDGTPATPGSGVQQDLNWNGAVRLRAGYAVDRFLPYIAGGVAFGDVDAEIFDTGVSVASFSETYVGWTIGAGVEYAFTDNMVGRFEYRYTDFVTKIFPRPSMQKASISTCRPATFDLACPGCSDSRCEWHPATAPASCRGFHLALFAAAMAMATVCPKIDSETLASG